MSFLRFIQDMVFEDVTIWEPRKNQKFNARALRKDQFYEGLRNAGQNHQEIRSLEFSRVRYSGGMKFIYDVVLKSEEPMEAEVFIDLDGLIQARFI